MSLTEGQEADSRSVHLEALARDLARAVREGGEIAEPIGQHALVSYAEADVVQSLLATDLGMGGGWKVAIDRRSGDDRLNAARIPPNRVLRSPAVRSLAGRSHAYIEAEFSIVLGTDLMARDGAIERSDVIAAVESAHLAFELLCSRFATDLRNLSPLHLAADFGGAEALILGAPVSPEAIAATGIVLTLEGVEVARSDRMPDDPFDLVARLARHRVEQGSPLRSHDVITTGAICFAPAEAGRFEARCGDAAVVLDLIG